MTRLSHVKLGIAVIGVVLWGYGVRVDDSTFRIIGIVFLAAAALLRFWKPKRGPDEPVP
jgi:hypothetical protein